ncbi:Uncharacterised protein [Campylobacter hyointestinalis subsp. hyointestinalis]|uniref:Uncharacterized protein n=1 Tax=Campylobacter hyointestinalis subsp. hyointestinalis TaxID=91352 RepID=A0A0S4SVX6_CAMHY|nr:hypothetical protein [Campylobacter hyointestinalis]CUU90475.1 Uncharacterised protein [Campylobacter hyointestinalis subsp. hyointestinalis]
MKPILSDTANELLSLYDNLNQNNDKFEQKIKITGLREAEGKEKTDKDGKVIVNEFGEVQRWDTKYYITYNSINSSGSHTTSVSQPLFVELEVGKNYIAKGHIEYKVYGDNYNSTPVIVFDKFVSERDNLIEALAIFKDSQNVPKA